MSIDATPLNRELLLQRIAAGGNSGKYLADAFVSAYRMKPFKHSLGAVIHLDAEALALFNQIIAMRHTVGWSDDELYQIEQAIISICNGDAQ
jgi:hypothetical protein